MRGALRFPSAQNWFRDLARVQNHMVRRRGMLVRYPLPARPKKPAHSQGSDYRSRARTPPPYDIDGRAWYLAGPLCLLRHSEICRLPDPILAALARLIGFCVRALDVSQNACPAWTQLVS